MKIAQKYSHLNGEEYLIVHHKNEYKEINNVIKKIDAKKHLTKISDEKNKKGKFLYNPKSLNEEFRNLFYALGWQEQKRNFYVSTDPNIVKLIEPLDFKQQKEFLVKLNHPLYDSYNQTLKTRLLLKFNLVNILP